MVLVVNFLNCCRLIVLDFQQATPIYQQWIKVFYLQEGLLAISSIRELMFTHLLLSLLGLVVASLYSS